MYDEPTKLTRYLESLPDEECRQRRELFQRAESLAREIGLQSPRFWAMRQVIAGRRWGQIVHEAERRRRRLCR